MKKEDVKLPPKKGGYRMQTSKPKPIYEVYLAKNASEEMIKNILIQTRNIIGDDYYVAVIRGDSETVKTKLRYPKATFWGWWYNLWNM